MDTQPPAVSDTPTPAALAATHNAALAATPTAALAAEIRHSALLLGGSLGLMGSFALLLLLVTTRLGS
jgi:hypothetical protein